MAFLNELSSSKLDYLVKITNILRISDIVLENRVFTEPFSVVVELRTLGYVDQINSSASSDILWYTNGSVMKQRVGFRVYTANLVPHLKVTRAVLQAEIKAILECAYLGPSNDYKGVNYTICSDNRAAIRVLDSAKMYHQN